MFAITVTFTIRAGEAAPFLKLVRENAQESLQGEKGCQQFDICYDRARPNMVFLYELYDNEAAFQAHLASKHYSVFQSATVDMVSHKEVHSFGQVFR